MIDYLGKFGKVFTSKVVHSVFSEGGLKGLRNGDRFYKMEVRPGTDLGSYHIIDGNKITLRYPGQQQTYARCHQGPQQCRGKGIARRCEAEFQAYILNLWKEVGYSPDNYNFSEIGDSEPGKVFPSASLYFTTGCFL